jgi:anti-sigma factor RsiW
MNLDDLNALPRELKQQLTRHVAPPGLKRRVSFMVEQQARAAQLASPLHRLRMWYRRGWLPITSFACGALVAMLAMPWLPWSGGSETLRQQLVDGHVRSLMVAHLTDVPSSDQHTVKPWFVGKLDYAPPVINLAAEGFALAGGRLDSLQGHAVAALVYKRNAHTINLFVRPQGGARLGPEFSSYRGYNLVRWRELDMEFQAVSDLNAQELKNFAELVSTRHLAQEQSPQ